MLAQDNLHMNTDTGRVAISVWSWNINSSSSPQQLKLILAHYHGWIQTIRKQANDIDIYREVSIPVNPDNHKLITINSSLSSYRQKAHTRLINTSLRAMKTYLMLSTLSRWYIFLPSFSAFDTACLLICFSFAISPWLSPDENRIIISNCHLVSSGKILWQLPSTLLFRISIRLSCNTTLSVKFELKLPDKHSLALLDSSMLPWPDTEDAMQNHCWNSCLDHWPREIERASKIMRVSQLIYLYSTRANRSYQ